MIQELSISSVIEAPEAADAPRPLAAPVCLGRVVHMTSVHTPYDNRILHKECAALALAGYSVTLIAARQGGGSEVISGVHIRYVQLPKSRPHRFLFTIPSVFFAALQEDASIYHLHDPELMPAGALLALLGKKSIYDIHEDYAASVRCKHWIPAPFRAFASFAVKACEHLLGGLCSYSIAATPVIGAQQARKRIALVQNFPKQQEMNLPAGVPYSNRAPLCVYIGALSTDRGLVEMIQSVENLQARIPVSLTLAGAFNRGADSNSGIQDFPASVQYAGVLSRPQVGQLLGRARIGLVVLHPTGNYINSQPTKLYEYMSAGIPVIASDFPIWRNVVESANCGILVDPMGTKAIAAAIEWLLANPQEAEAMGLLGKAAVQQHYNWENEAASLLNVYQQLMQEAR